MKVLAEGYYHQRGDDYDLYDKAAGPDCETCIPVSIVRTDELAKLEQEAHLLRTTLATAEKLAPPYGVLRGFLDSAVKDILRPNARIEPGRSE